MSEPQRYWHDYLEWLESTETDLAVEFAEIDMEHATQSSDNVVSAAHSVPTSLTYEITPEGADQLLQAWLHYNDHACAEAAEFLDTYLEGHVRAAVWAFYGVDINDVDGEASTSPCDPEDDTPDDSGVG